MKRLPSPSVDSSVGMPEFPEKLCQNNWNPHLLWNSNYMWFESLPSGRSWASLWSGYIRYSCGGIRTFQDQCNCRPQDHNGPIFRRARAAQPLLTPTLNERARP